MIHIHQCTFLAQGNSAWENGSTISVNRVKEIIAKKLKGLENLSGSVRLKKLTLDLGEFETLSFNNEFIERLENSCKDLESKLRDLQRAQMAERNAEQKAQFDELIAFLYSLEYTQEVQNAIYLLEFTGIVPNLSEWEEFLSKYQRMFGDQLNLELRKSLKPMLRSAKKSGIDKIPDSSPTKKKARSDDFDQNHIDFIVESLDRIPMNTHWFQALDDLFFKEFGSKMSMELHNRIRDVYDSFEFDLGSTKTAQLTQTEQQVRIKQNEQLLSFFESIDESEEVVLMRNLLKQHSNHSESLFADIFALYKQKFGKNISRELEEQLFRFQQEQNPIFLKDIDPSKRKRILNKLMLLSKLSSPESKSKRKNTSKRTHVSNEEYTFLCNQLNSLSINASWYSRLLSSYQRKFNTTMPEHLQRVFLSFSRSILEPENVSIAVNRDKKPSASDFAALVRTLDSSSKLLPFLQTLEGDQLESEHDFLSAYRTYFGHSIDSEDSALLHKAQSYSEQAHFRAAISRSREEFLKLFMHHSDRTKVVSNDAKGHWLSHEILDASVLENAPINIGWISEINTKHQEIYHRNLPRKSARKLMQLLNRIHGEVRSKRSFAQFDFQKSTQIAISTLRKQLKGHTGITDSKDLLHILPTEKSAQASITFGELMAGFSTFYGRELSLKLKQLIWSQNEDVLVSKAKTSSVDLKQSAKKGIEKQLSSGRPDDFSDAQLSELVKTFFEVSSDVDFSGDQSFSSFQNFFQFKTGTSLPNNRKSLLRRLWKELPKRKGESQLGYSRQGDLDNQVSKTARKIEHSNQEETVDEKPKSRDRSSDVLHPDFVRPAIDFILEYLDRPRLSENWIKLLLDEFQKEFNCSFPSVWQDILNKYYEEQIPQQTLKAKLVVFLSQNLEMPGADKLLQFLSNLRDIASLEALFGEYEDYENEALPLGLKMMLHRWLKTMNEQPVSSVDMVFSGSQSDQIGKELREQYDGSKSENQLLKSKLIVFLSQDREFSESKNLMEFISNVDEIDSFEALFDEYEAQYNTSLPIGLRQMLHEWGKFVKDEFFNEVNSSFPSIRQESLEKAFRGDWNRSLKAKLITFLSQDREFLESKKLMEFISKVGHVDSLETLYDEYETENKTSLPIGLKQMLREWWKSVKDEYSNELNSSFPSIRQESLEKVFRGDLNQSLKAKLITFLSQDREFSESKKLMEFISKVDEIDSLDALYDEYETVNKTSLSIGLKQMLREWWKSVKDEYSNELKLSFPSTRQESLEKAFRGDVNNLLKAKLITFLSEDSEFSESKRLIEFISKVGHVDSLETLYDEYETENKTSLSIGLKRMLHEWCKSVKDEFSNGLNSSFPSIGQESLEKAFSGDVNNLLKAKLITFLSQDRKFSESKKLMEFISKVGHVDSLETLYGEYETENKTSLPKGLKQMLREWWKSVKGEFSNELNSSFPSIRQESLEKAFRGDLNQSLKTKLITFLSQDREFSESKKLMEFMSNVDEIYSLDWFFDEYKNHHQLELPKGLKFKLQSWWKSIKEKFDGEFDSLFSTPATASAKLFWQSEGTEDQGEQNVSNQLEINVLHQSIDRFFETNAKKQEKLMQFLHFMIDSVPMDVYWLPKVVEHYKRQFKEEIPSELFDRLMNFTEDLSKEFVASGSKYRSNNTQSLEIGQLIDEVSPENAERIKKIFDEVSLSKRAFSVVDFVEKYERRYQEQVPHNVVERMVQIHARSRNFSWKLLPTSLRKELIESLKETLTKEETSRNSPDKFNERLTFLIQVLEHTPIDASWFARIRSSYETKFDSDLSKDIALCLLSFSEKISLSQSVNEVKKITEPNEQGKDKDINLEFKASKQEEFHTEKQLPNQEKKSNTLNFHLESKRFLSSKWEQFKLGWVDINEIQKEYSRRFSREVPRDILEVFESKAASQRGEKESLPKEIDQFLRKNGTNEQIAFLTKLVDKTTELTSANWFESILKSHKTMTGSSLPLDAQQLLLRFAAHKSSSENHDESDLKKQLEKWKKEQVIRWKKYAEKVLTQLKSEAKSAGLKQLDFISECLSKSLLTEKEIALLELAFQKQFDQLIPVEWKNELAHISKPLERRVAKEASQSKSPSSVENERVIQHEKKVEFLSGSAPKTGSQSIQSSLVKHIEASSLSTEKSTLIELVKQLPKNVGNAWFQELMEAYRSRKHASMPAPWQGVLLTFMQENSNSTSSSEEESLDDHELSSQKESIPDADMALEKLLSKGLSTSLKELDLTTFFSQLVESNFKELGNFNRSFRLWFGTNLPSAVKRTLHELDTRKNDLRSRLLNFLKSENLKEITQLVRSTEKLTKDNWIETLNKQCTAQFKRPISLDEQSVLLSFAAKDEFTLVRSEEDKFNLVYYGQVLKDLVQYVKSNHSLLIGVNERYHLIKNSLERARLEKKSLDSRFTEGLRQKFKVYFNQKLSANDLKMMIEVVRKTNKHGVYQASRSRLRPSKPLQRKMISNKMKLIRLREELKAIKEGKKLDESTVVTNAGLVFGWVFWKSIFEGFSWLEDGRFIHTREKDTALLAANWLHCAVNEYETVNPLILYICGLDEKEFEHITEEELEREMNGEPLRQSIQGYYELILSMWPIFALENLSDFIALFVEREALILESPVGIKLKLVKEPIDALTEQHPVPWPVSMINFSWTTQIIEVEW